MQMTNLFNQKNNCTPNVAFLQPQRPEARESAPGWEEQHSYRWLWYGLSTGGRQSPRDQLWVSTFARRFRNLAYHQVQFITVNSTDLLGKIEILQLQMCLDAKYMSFLQDSALIRHFLFLFRSPHYACPEVIRVSVFAQWFPLMLALVP